MSLEWVVTIGFSRDGGGMQRRIFGKWDRMSGNVENQVLYINLSISCHVPLKAPLNASN